jgi:Lon protease-like protein
MNNNYPETLAIIPLKDTVLFPGNVLSLRIRRDENSKSAYVALSKLGYFGCIPYKASSTGKQNDLEAPKEVLNQKMGCLAKTSRVQRSFSDPSTLLVLIEGRHGTLE